MKITNNTDNENTDNTNTDDNDEKTQNTGKLG
jgi:hypothetical protein